MKKRMLIAALVATGAFSSATSALAADTVTFKPGTPPASETGCTFGKGVTTCATPKTRTWSVTTVEQLPGGCSRDSTVTTTGTYYKHQGAPNSNGAPLEVTNSTSEPSKSAATCPPGTALLYRDNVSPAGTCNGLVPSTQQIVGYVSTVDNSDTSVSVHYAVSGVEPSTLVVSAWTCKSYEPQFTTDSSGNGSTDFTLPAGNAGTTQNFDGYIGGPQGVGYHIQTPAFTV